MKSAESSSAAESTMNDNSTEPLFAGEDEDNEDFHGGGEDPAIWAAFTEKFRQVQSVLDRNRALIQQVNENHQSKLHDNMVKNVALIQEINANISKVVSLYSDLSTNFSNVFHQKNSERKNVNDE